MAKAAVDKMMINGKVYHSADYLSRKHKCSYSRINKIAFDNKIEKMTISGTNYYVDDERFQLTVLPPAEMRTNGEGKKIPAPAPTYLQIAHKIDRILHIQEQMEEALIRIEEYITRPEGSNYLKESNADSQ